MAKVTVGTGVYKRVHGAPRGRGLWQFTLHRGGSATRFSHSGLFSSAKAAAVREARSLGCDHVEVQP